MLGLCGAGFVVLPEVFALVIPAYGALNTYHIVRQIIRLRFDYSLPEYDFGTVSYLYGVGCVLLMTGGLLWRVLSRVK